VPSPHKRSEILKIMKDPVLTCFILLCEKALLLCRGIVSLYHYINWIAVSVAILRKRIQQTLLALSMRWLKIRVEGPDSISN
jgi:hypothetical protein